MKTDRPRVLIVDDSRTAALAIRTVLERHDIRVVGEAPDGHRALALIRTLRPDLITMDIKLPGGDGIDITSRIMAEVPTPVLIVTSLDARDSALVYRAMQAGAVDLVGKPPAPGSPGYEEASRRLAKLVKALAQVPVVRRTRIAETPTPPPADSRWSAGTRCTLLLLGASTGGPVVVRGILRALRPPLPVPVALVQHILPGFIAGFAAWLEAETGHRVQLVNALTPLSPGTVYVADDAAHLQLADARNLAAVSGPPIDNHRPSIDRLFETAATHVGCEAAAVLMTGMGRDGARGLRVLFDAGALTIAQHPDTCAVASMPNSAIALGAAHMVRSPDGVAAEIRTLLGVPER